MTAIQSRLLVDEAAMTERMLAFVRGALAIATLGVAVKLYYEVQFEYRPMSFTLELVLAYSLAMSLITRHRPLAIRKAAAVSSVIEVILITTLIASTGGSDSPFYLWYVFYIVSVSLRYGLQISILALAASIVLYTFVTTSRVSLSLAGNTFIPAFMGGTGLLFILAFLFGHMSERQKSYRMQLAVVNDLGIALSSLSGSSRIEEQLTAQAAALLGVEKCWYAALGDHSSEGAARWVGPDSPPAETDLGDWAPDRVIHQDHARMANRKSRRDAGVNEAAKSLGVRTLAAVPLVVHDKPVGVFYAVNHRVGPFTAADLHLLELIAGQAAPLLENARLAERLRDAAASEERLRIARDLHDNFLQTLAAIKLHLERCNILVDKDPGKAKDAIGRAQEIAAEGLSGVRSYLSQLRLAGPEPEGLREAIQVFVEEAAAGGGFSAHLRLRFDPKLITQNTCSAVFQIARELVHNAARHARPANVTLSVRTSPKQLVLSVEDDGIGFDVDQVLPAAAGAGHLGLIGVQERVAGLGGTLSITSRPGDGTTVTVRLPVLGS